MNTADSCELGDPATITSSLPGTSYAGNCRSHTDGVRPEYDVVRRRFLFESRSHAPSNFKRSPSPPIPQLPRPAAGPRQVAKAVGSVSKASSTMDRSRELEPNNPCSAKHVLLWHPPLSPTFGAQFEMTGPLCHVVVTGLLLSGITAVVFHLSGALDFLTHLSPSRSPKSVNSN